MKTISLLSVCLLSCLPFVAYSQNKSEQWEKISVGAPHKATVISATRISVDGVICQLLGVVDPTDATKASLAKKFSEEYFKQYGQNFSAYNSSNPLSTTDGTPVVWIIGHGNGGALNTELVRTGILLPQLDLYPDYSFTMAGKATDYVAPWRQWLKEAAEDAKQGKPANLPHPYRLPSK